eukprot:UN05221
MCLTSQTHEYQALYARYSVSNGTITHPCSHAHSRYCFKTINFKRDKVHNHDEHTMKFIIFFVFFEPCVEVFDIIQRNGFRRTFRVLSSFTNPQAIAC